MSVNDMILLCFNAVDRHKHSLQAPRSQLAHSDPPIPTFTTTTTTTTTTTIPTPRTNECIAPIHLPSSPHPSNLPLPSLPPLPPPPPPPPSLPHYTTPIVSFSCARKSLCLMHGISPPRSLSPIPPPYLPSSRSPSPVNRRDNGSRNRRSRDADISPSPSPSPPPPPPPPPYAPSVPITQLFFAPLIALLGRAWYWRHEEDDEYPYISVNPSTTHPPAYDAAFRVPEATHAGDVHTLVRAVHRHPCYAYARDGFLPTALDLLATIPRLFPTPSRSFAARDTTTASSTSTATAAAAASTSAPAPIPVASTFDILSSFDTLHAPMLRMFHVADAGGSPHLPWVWALRLAIPRCDLCVCVEPKRTDTLAYLPWEASFTSNNRAVGLMVHAALPLEATMDFVVSPNGMRSIHDICQCLTACRAGGTFVLHYDATDATAERLLYVVSTCFARVYLRRSPFILHAASHNATWIGTERLNHPSRIASVLCWLRDVAAVQNDASTRVGGESDWASGLTWTFLRPLSFSAWAPFVRAAFGTAFSDRDNGDSGGGGGGGGGGDEDDDVAAECGDGCRRIDRGGDSDNENDVNTADHLVVHEARHGARTNDSVLRDDPWAVPQLQCDTHIRTWVRAEAAHCARHQDALVKLHWTMQCLTNMRAHWFPPEAQPIGVRCALQSKERDGDTHDDKHTTTATEYREHLIQNAIKHWTRGDDDDDAAVEACHTTTCRDDHVACVSSAGEIVIAFDDTRPALVVLHQCSMSVAQWTLYTWQGVCTSQTGRITCSLPFHATFVALASESAFWLVDVIQLATANDELAACSYLQRRARMCRILASGTCSGIVRCAVCCLPRSRANPAPYWHIHMKGHKTNPTPPTETASTELCYSPQHEMNDD